MSETTQMTGMNQFSDLYKFVYKLMNSYKNYFYGTKKETGGDFNPEPLLRLQSLLWLPSTTPPPPSVAILFIYRTRRIEKNIQKLRLYNFILVTYSHPQNDNRFK